MMQFCPARAKKRKRESSDGSPSKKRGTSFIISDDDEVGDPTFAQKRRGEQFLNSQVLRSKLKKYEGENREAHHVIPAAVVKAKKDCFKKPEYRGEKNKNKFNESWNGIMLCTNNKVDPPVLTHLPYHKRGGRRDHNDYNKLVLKMPKLTEDPRETAKELKKKIREKKQPDCLDDIK